jgi:hypothetical protein
MCITQQIGWLGKIILLVLYIVGIGYSQSKWDIISLPQGSVVPSLSTPNSNDAPSIVYGNGHFVGIFNGKILTSLDGTTWSIVNDSAATDLMSVIYGGDQFVVVGLNGKILTSPNGENWSVRNSGISMRLYSVSYGNGIFVAVGLGKCGTLNSQDGISWTSQTNNGCMSDENLSKIVYGNNEFIAMGDRSLSSSEGIVWNSIPSKLTGGLNGYSVIKMAWFNGKFVLLKENSIFSFASLNDTNCTIYSDPDNNTLYSVTYGNGEFVVVGSNGTILTSPDCFTWTKRNSGTTEGLYLVAFGNDRFVAFSEKGIMVVSESDNSRILIQPQANINTISGIKITYMNKTIFVSLSNLSAHLQLEAELFTVVGKRIFHASVKANHNILNIPSGGFPAGMYLMSITNNNERAITCKFILTR